MTSQSIKTLGVFIKPGLFDKGLGALLPEAYRKFYKEWKLTEPTAVHYIPEEGTFKRDELTGEVSPVQNIPLPTFIPKEAHSQLWGGEAVVQGFQKRDKYSRRVPHFWVPTLKRTVVYCEVLDIYVSVIVTNRAISLINENFGFDHYLLKTPACDLKTLLPLGIKRKILQELEKGCPTYADRPEKQKEVYERYKEYLKPYTSEEIKWYGYSYTEACNIMKENIEASKKIVPLKQIYRAQMIENLKKAELELGSNLELEGKSGSWLQKINPFTKKET